MFKPAQKLLVISLLLLAGCGGANSDYQPETSSPASPPVEQAPTTTNPESPSPAESAEALADTVVIPGDRVGPITYDTTRQDLVDLFGEENLTDEEVNVGEGFTESGTRVDLGEAESFSVLWSDETQTHVAEVRELGSAWETPEGIHIGTSFSELQSDLGDFDLYGMGWDYSGTVILEGTNLEKYDESLILRLHPTENAAEQETAAFRAVAGDAQFSSSNPNFEALDLEVRQMIVRLTPEAGE